jgi:hypothetical protein
MNSESGKPPGPNSDRNGVVAEPQSIARLIELMVGELEHGGDNLGLFGHNVVVCRPGRRRRQETGAFVPVNKAVIL